ERVAYRQGLETEGFEFGALVILLVVSSTVRIMQGRGKYSIGAQGVREMELGMILFEVVGLVVIVSYNIPRFVINGTCVVKSSVYFHLSGVYAVPRLVRNFTAAEENGF